jgi:hypothetical protein
LHGEEGSKMAKNHKKKSTPEKKRIILKSLLQSSDKSFFSIGRLALLGLLLIVGVIFYRSLPQTPEKPILLFKNVPKIRGISWSKKGGNWEISKDKINWKLKNYSGVITNARSEVVNSFLNFLERISGSTYSKNGKIKFVVGKIAISTSKGVTNIEIARSEAGQIVLRRGNNHYFITGINIESFFPVPDKLMDTVVFRFNHKKVKSMRVGVSTFKGDKHYNINKVKGRWLVGGTLHGNSFRLDRVVELISLMTFRRIIETPFIKEKSPLWKVQLQDKTQYKIFNIGMKSGEKLCPPGEKPILRESFGFSLPICISEKIHNGFSLGLPDILEDRLLPVPLKGKWTEIVFTGSIKGKVKKHGFAWELSTTKGSQKGDPKVIPSFIAKWLATPVTQPVKVTEQLIPISEVVFKTGSESWQVSILKNPKGQLFLQRKGELLFFKGVRGIEFLVPYSIDYFRDRRLLPGGAIKSITRRGLGLIEKLVPGRNGVLRIVKPLELPVSTKKMVELAKALASLRADSFLEKSPQIVNLKIKKPEGKITKKPAVTKLIDTKKLKKKKKSSYVTIEVAYESSKVILINLKRNRSVGWIEKGIEFTLDENLHKLLTHPWVGINPFSWPPSKAQKFSFQFKDNLWTIVKKKGFWVVKNRDKTKILTRLSVMSFFKSVEQNLASLEPQGYGKIKYPYHIHILMSSGQGLPQEIVSIEKNGILYLQNRRWPIIWTLPTKKILFLKNQF